MTEKTIIDFTILSVTFASAFVIVGYEDHARMKGWPVGAWLVGGTSFLKILAFVTMLISLGASTYINGGLLLLYLPVALYSGS